MARQLTGFLPYGQADDDVIVRDPLTAAPVTGMTLRGTRTLDSVRGSIFDNGGDGLAGLGINWATLGYTAATVINGCSWSVEVESGWLAQAGGAFTEQLFSSYISSTTRINGPRLNSGLAYLDYLIRAGKYTSRFELNPSSYQDRDYVTVYCSYHFGGTLDTYIDQTLVSSTEFTSGSDANILDTLFNNFHVGNDSSSSGPAPVSHYMRNFQFINRPLTLCTHPKLRNVHAYSDSFLDRGGYPDDYWPALWLKPDYPATSGEGSTAVTNSTTTFRDFGALPTLQRYLAERDVFIGKQWQQRSAVNGSLLNGAPRCIQNYGIGGSGVDSGNLTYYLSQQIDRALNRGDVPDMAVFHMGQNDISTLAVTFNAAWKTLYTDEIDRILTRNPNCKLVICTATSLRNDPTYQTSTYNDRTAACNAYIEEIVNDYSEAYLCDLFTAFGGHDFDSSLFASGDRHPSATGSKLIGETIGATAITTI